ncbi:MAG TPA: DciA family protein [Usitatibacteraceae bacterium]
MKNAGHKTGFKPIHALMGENEAIAPMLQRLNLISRFQQTYVSTIPAGLNASSRVAAVEGTTLVIAAANGAVAASLKQMLPRLLAKFQENKMQEQEVTAIRVVVQPESLALDREPPRRTRATTVAPIAPMPDSSLGKLAEALEESPLKTTIQQIQKRRERALTVRKKTV